MPSIVTLKAVITADDTAFHTTVQRDVKELGDLEKSAAAAAGGVKKLGESERSAAGDTQRFGDAAEKAAHSSRGLSFAASALQSAVSGVAIGVGQFVAGAVVNLGKQALQSAVQMDSLRKGLVAVTGSAAAAAAEMKDLREVAKLPGLGMAEAVQGAIRLQAAGLSAKEAKGALMGFGNALATVGKGKTELGFVEDELTRLASTSKLSGRSILELSRQVPQLRQIMKQAFGTADAAAIEKSGVSSKKFLDTITQQLLKMPKVTSGIQNDLENLQDSGARALTSLGELMLPLASKITQAVAPALDSLSEKLHDLAPTIQPVFAGVVAATQTIAAKIRPLLAAAWEGVKADVQAVKVAWDTNFAGIRTSTQAVAVAVSGFVKQHFGEVTQWFRDNMPLIQETVKNGLAAVQRFWNLYGADIVAGVKAAWGVLTAAITMGMRIVTDVVRLALLVVNGHWAKAGDALLKLTGDIMGGVVKVTGSGSDLVIAAFKGIIKGIWNLQNWSMSVADDIGNAIIKGIVNGIKAGAGAVWAAMRNLLTNPSADNITAAAKTAFSFASPIAGMVGMSAGAGAVGGADNTGVSLTGSGASPLADVMKSFNAAYAETKAKILADNKALSSTLKGGGKAGGAGAGGGESDIGGAVKKKLTEAQRQAKEFVQFAAEQRSALAAAVSGEDSAVQQLAKRFYLVGAARRSVVAGIMDHVKAIMAERDAAKALTEKVADLRRELTLARAKTPEQKARLELNLPFGPLPQQQQRGLKDYVDLSGAKDMQDAAKAAADTLKGTRKSMLDGIEQERRSMLAAQATREIDRVSILQFGRAYDTLTDATNKWTVKQQAAWNAAKAIGDFFKGWIPGMNAAAAASQSLMEEAVKPLTDQTEQLRREIGAMSETTQAGKTAWLQYGEPLKILPQYIRDAIGGLDLMQKKMNAIQAVAQAFSGAGAMRLAFAGMQAAGAPGVGMGFDQFAASATQQQQQEADRAKQQRRFVEGLTASALRYGRGFTEALLNGGGGVKKWFSNLVQSSIPAFTDTIIERTIKPQLENIFSGMVKSVTGTLNVTQQAVGQMLASVYSLLTVLGGQGKKKQGFGILGGLLGAGLGLAIGGPAGALKGFNIGVAAGSGFAGGGAGGALLGGGLSYVSQRGGPGAIFGSGKGSGKTVSMETGSSSSSLGSGNAGASLNAAMSRGQHVHGDMVGVQVQNLNVSRDVDMTVVSNKLARLAAGRASR